MFPTVINSSSNNNKIIRPIPKLPEINCVREEGDDDDSIDDEEEEEELLDQKRITVKGHHHRQCDGFESDEDIEILLRKTKFLRHSKSAHADLALPTSNRKKANNLLNGYGIQEEKENSSSDSDEEFYVHQSLLPFRKSKSSTVGFEGIEAKTVEIKNLGTFKASKVLEVIEKQTAEMLKSQEPEVATFVSNTIDYWPPPEEEEDGQELHEAISRRISKAKKSIVSVENESHGFPLIPFGRTASVDSDGIISVGAWSAPAQVASDSDENSEDEIVGGEKMRSWSATERPCTIENEEEKFCTRKGISLSCERSHHCIYDEIVDELWKGHLSCDDLTEPEIIYDDTCDSPGHMDYNQNNNPFNCIQELEEFSCSPGLNINLQTPSSFTPSPVMPGSKSDSALRFYTCDRPKTPLCGEPNPSNSTQNIYDPWHADAVDDVAPPGPIRSRSCHDTFESTGTEEEARMLRHCQMCPSPDCKQIIEQSQKLSIRENLDSDSVTSVDTDDEEEDLRIKRAFEAQIEKMQQFAEGETASLLVHHEDEGSIGEDDDCDNRSFTVFDDEIPMADDPSVDSPLNAYLVKKFILNRSSPPMASEDDLSDVEMTEIGSDEENTADLPPKHDLRYNLSSMLVRKSHSDFGWKSAAMKTDESVGNLNYWLQEKQQPSGPGGEGGKGNVKRSSTTSAMLHRRISNTENDFLKDKEKLQHQKTAETMQSSKMPKEKEEPIYANLQPQFLFNNKNEKVKSKIPQNNSFSSSSSPMNQQPQQFSASSKERIFPWNIPSSAQQHHQQQQQQPVNNHSRQRMHKSATFVGVQGYQQPQRNRNVRRLLPLRPDFPATPEEPPEYVNLPYSTSYHEQVGSRSFSSDTAAAATGASPSALCFFPTTSYNCSKELQHENFARIQIQMSAKNEPLAFDGGERYQQHQMQQRPSKLLSAQSRGPSFTALTLADELENEKRGIPPERIDPVLEKRITEGQQIPLHNQLMRQSQPPQRLEDPSPMSPGNFFPSSKRPQQRRTLPPLPVEAHGFAAFAAAMAAAQSPTIFPLAPSRNTPSHHPPPNQPQPKEDHQICYGIEASMLRSTSGIYGMEDSYYEDGINGNFTTTRKSNSAFNNQEDSSGVSSCCTGTDSINPTHRVQSSFIPRHDDEILLEIGDAIHVERECEDHWCYGTNLRSGQHGIFPAAHICEIDLVEEICNNALINASTRVLPPPERDTFYLTMLASIEVAHHKGNDVLVQSINKVCSMYQDKEEIIVPQTILMEVSFRGIHIIDKRRKDFFKCPAFDFFYSLQNISFCGAHPKQLRYFGFITKHPLLPRFACHVFLSNESTQPIVESIGRAFKRSYDEYMAFAHPTEDIYIE